MSAPRCWAHSTPGAGCGSSRRTGSQAWQLGTVAVAPTPRLLRGRPEKDVEGRAGLAGDLQRRHLEPALRRDRHRPRQRRVVAVADEVDLVLEALQPLREASYVGAERQHLRVVVLGSGRG